MTNIQYFTQLSKNENQFEYFPAERETIGESFSRVIDLAKEKNCQILVKVRGLPLKVSPTSTITDLKFQVVAGMILAGMQ